MTDLLNRPRRLLLTNTWLYWFSATGHWRNVIMIFVIIIVNNRFKHFVNMCVYKCTYSELSCTVCQCYFYTRAVGNCSSFQANSYIVVPPVMREATTHWCLACEDGTCYTCVKLCNGKYLLHFIILNAAGTALATTVGYSLTQWVMFSNFRKY
jgi:hypothetical protein